MIKGYIICKGKDVNTFIINYYNKQEKITKSIFKDKVKKNISVEEWKYDNQGRELKAVFTGHDGKKRIYNYQYDLKNHKIIHSGKNEKGKIIETVTDEFDNKGNFIRQIRKQGNKIIIHEAVKEKKKNLVDKTIVKNGSGRILKFEEFFKKDGDDIYVSTCYKYNKNGKVIDKIKKSVASVSQQDKNDNLTRLSHKNKKGKITDYTEYKYNEDKRLKEVADYDQNNNLLQRCVYKYFYK